MFEVAIERGPKRRTFAQVQEWMGWLRSGKDEHTALHELLATSSRYALVAARAGVSFPLPTSPDDFTVVERVTGSAVTDYGAPGVLSAWDTQPWQAEEIERCARLLQACWATFDEALQLFPISLQEVKPQRGRSPLAIRLHLVETDLMHLSAFGPPARPADQHRLAEQEAGVREQLLVRLRAISPGEPHTPHRRYGFDWTPRFALRRSAWHVLDHAWELQARLGQNPFPGSSP